MKQSATNITIQGNALKISISGIISVRTVDRVLMQRLEDINPEACLKIRELILDLKAVRSITPAAAISLVCLCAEVTSGKMKDIAKPVKIYCNRPPEHVLSYLMTLGFYTQLSTKAGCGDYEDLVHREVEIKERALRKKKQNASKQRMNSDERSVVWPLDTIPCKETLPGSKDFENACQQFINNAYDNLEGILSSPSFNFSGSDMAEFFTANGELYENIFEHSNSWGLCTLHARRDQGTTVCYHDIGIGIKESINTSPKVGKEINRFDTDYDAIVWALVEGHSSKDGRNGRGLNIVEEYVLTRSGYIELRSGQSLFYKKRGDKPGQKAWRHEKVPFFPGTQINFFIPATQRYMMGTKDGYDKT